MCEQDRIHARYVEAERLLAEIGRSVDEDSAAVVIHNDRRTQPVVPGIVRVADRAIAADGRHTDAGARSEHGDAEEIRRHATRRPVLRPSAARQAEVPSWMLRELEQNGI